VTQVPIEFVPPLEPIARRGGAHLTRIALDQHGAATPGVIRCSLTLQNPAGVERLASVELGLGTGPAIWQIQRQVPPGVGEHVVELSVPLRGPEATQVWARPAGAWFGALSENLMLWPQRSVGEQALLAMDVPPGTEWGVGGNPTRHSGRGFTLLQRWRPAIITIQGKPWGELTPTTWEYIRAVRGPDGWERAEFATGAACQAEVPGFGLVLLAGRAPAAGPPTRA